MPGADEYLLVASGLFCASQSAPAALCAPESGVVGAQASTPATVSSGTEQYDFGAGLGSQFENGEAGASITVRAVAKTPTLSFPGVLLAWPLPLAMVIAPNPPAVLIPADGATVEQGSDKFVHFSFQAKGAWSHAIKLDLFEGSGCKNSSLKSRTRSLETRSR